MKIRSFLIGALLTVAFHAMTGANAHAQDIWIHSPDKTIDKKIHLSQIDSITVDKCDSTIYDLDGCDVDIDSVDVLVQCGTVNLAAHIDGLPSYIAWTIYDIDGNVILTSTGSANLSFSLPTYGSYYGTLEVSCGGGDERGGDEDEDAFEIDYNLPTAMFTLDAASSFVGSSVVLDLLPENLSTGSNPVYAWIVKDSVTGVTVATSSLETPVFPGLDASRTYLVILGMTDDRGCTSLYQSMRTADNDCKSKFTWKYSWCHDNPGTDNVSVQFWQRWSIPSVATSMRYEWTFGDGPTINSTDEDPVHTYACANASQAFTITLNVITYVSNPDGTLDSCTKSYSKTITLEAYEPDFTITKCCDGRVVFCTNSDYGEWDTPGAMNMCNASTCKKLTTLLPGRSCGLQSNFGHCGQTYWRYYASPGSYTVTFNGHTKDNNYCSKTKDFQLESVGCFNRNVHESLIDSFNGYDFKLKFKVVQWPFIHKIIAKIKAKHHKKMKEIHAQFSGVLHKLGSNGCFCDTTSVAADPGNTFNKRKAKAKLNSLGRFRVGMDSLTATFTVKTPNNMIHTWTMQLGNLPCDLPCVLWY